MLSQVNLNLSLGVKLLQSLISCRKLVINNFSMKKVATVKPEAPFTNMS